MDERGKNVDADTKVALLELKNELIEAFTSIVKTSNKELGDSLEKLHELRFNHIEKDQERSFKYHEEHYAEFRKVYEKIEDLSSRQSNDEGGAKTADKMKSFYENKKLAIWSIIFGIIGAAIGGAFALL